METACPATGYIRIGSSGGSRFQISDSGDECGPPSGCRSASGTETIRRASSGGWMVPPYCEGAESISGLRLTQFQGFKGVPGRKPENVTKTGSKCWLAPSKSAENPLNPQRLALHNFFWRAPTPPWLPWWGGEWHGHAHRGCTPIPPSPSLWRDC